MSQSVVDALVGQRKTLMQFVLQEERRIISSGRQATGELTSLINDLATACKVISMLVSKGPKLGILGAADNKSHQGDDQKTLDVISNTVFLKNNEYNGHIGGMVSEELEGFYEIPAMYPKGKYLLCFDPLDGSSNIEVNVSVGTIFSIFKANDNEEITEKSFLQKGSSMVGAGYCVYGPQTTLVLSFGEGVNGFTLDSDVGEFLLSYPDMKVPVDTKEYAINTSNKRHWDPPVRRYVEECEQGSTGPRGKDFNMRWVGSMVADVHRILIRGGVFMYPDDAKIRKSGMKGRLRYLYEVAPMAYLIEQAGGLAHTGTTNALDVLPETIHERTPVILGSKNEVLKVAQYYEEWRSEEPASKKAKSS